MAKAKEQDSPALPAGDETKTTALALPEDMASRFADNAGAGLEDFNGGDFAIPFLIVLQKNSPQVDEASGKYIEGAKAGTVYNTVTNKLYDVAELPNKGATGVLGLVVAAYQKMMVEWVPRDNGGGFVGQHLPDSPTHRSAKPDKDKPNKLVLPNGNNLVETCYYYVVVDDEDGPQWAVIAMSSTQLKQSRILNTLIAAQKIKNAEGVSVACPMFGQLYAANTKPESNDYGTWMGWKIASAGLVQEAALFDAARTYREAVRGGRVRATAPPVEQDADLANASKAGASGDCPF